ncbi:MAG TPA: hypothetical protein VFQ65_26440, partial [Kofleriaceae bacterium]|nr:hypothetical protein [Kofleriaceae bacterium]
MLALGVPAVAARYVATSTAALADHLGAAAGVPARIGRVDADLTARIRLSDVALGSLFAADAIEASVGLDSLLSGQLGADEIRVAGPRVAVEVDRTGDSDLARVVRRLAKTGTSHTGTTRLRRIVVSSGVLVAHVPGLGDVSAEDVELVPDAGGVRVITGKLRLRGEAERVQGELVLSRASAEVALPHVKFGRLLAVNGSGEVTVPGAHGGTSQTIPLRDVSIGRLVAGGSLELRAALDDGGIPRHLAAEVAPPAADGSLAITLRGEHLPLRAFASLAPHGLVLDDAHARGALAIRRTGPKLAFTVDGTLDGA